MEDEIINAKTNVEELKKLNGYELAIEMQKFKNDYISSMDSDDPQKEWNCLISMVEDQDVKFDDLSTYGFIYFDEEKMKEDGEKSINFYLQKALIEANKINLTKEDLIEKLKNL